MGFAARARKLAAGYNTCIYMMEKKKVRLLVLAEDLADSSAKKMISAAERYGVPWKRYGTKEQLSRRTGNEDKGIYGILDEELAKVIFDRIDDMTSSEKEVF